MRRRLVGITIGLTLLVAATAAAQRATVLVVNVMTPDGRPVAEALVRLRNLGRLARTDWLGEASLAGLPRGRQRIEVLRVGYAPAVTDLLIQHDTTGAQFILEPLADTLAAVNVRARAPSMPIANLRDYERRKAMGIGRFRDDTVFERQRGQHMVLTLAQLFPGLRAAPDDLPGKYRLISGRGSPRFKDDGVCKVDVYMDGVRIASDLEILAPQDISGAELYSMESAPPQYRTQSKACHVLLLWTRY